MDWFATWYLNFVRIPSMPNIPDDQKPAVTKVIAPKVLFWFRYAALATILSGLIVAYLNGYLHQSMTLGIGDGGGKNTAMGKWYVVRYNHGLQCMVYNLARSKKSFRYSRGRFRGKTFSWQKSNVNFACKHIIIYTHVIDNGGCSKSLLI